MRSGLIDSSQLISMIPLHRVMPRDHQRANCSRKYIPRASLFVGPLTGGSSYIEGVGSAIPEILIFTPPLCNTLCISWLGWCSPILGVPTQWVNARVFFDFHRSLRRESIFFFRTTRSSRRRVDFFFGIFPFFKTTNPCGVSPLFLPIG